MSRLPPLASLLLTGCIWITDGDHADRMDLDGDGLPYDQDCDDNDATVGAPTTFLTDGDGDGYGDPAAATQACTAPDGTVPDMGTGMEDCDDGDASVNPAAVESCDGLDNDCDELVDDDDDGLTGGDDWYPDLDGDGFGDGEADPVQACVAPADHTSPELASDCDDGDASVYPDAPEHCDGVDHDCDGEVNDDDAVDAETWYLDGDGDGYGLDDQTATACAPPDGYAEVGGDCDDSDAAFNPGALEDDCGDPADYNCDGSTGYADEDGDGWAACEECDDGDASTHPAAPEYCDGADNDCDGVIDDLPVDGSTWYIDSDGDGFGSATSTLAACDRPPGYDDDDDDCDDGDATINPDADELPTDACFDGVDNDCDGDTDGDDASCAACPYPCAAETCLWVDGALEAEQSTALVAAMADIDTLVLGHAVFDRALVGAAGEVLAAEDFGAGLGCFAAGSLAGAALDAGTAAACSFPDQDLGSGDWVVVVDVLAGSTDASLALMDTSLPGSNWYGWGTTPLLDDGDGATVPFAGGAPDQGVDHTVVMCGMTP